MKRLIAQPVNLAKNKKKGKQNTSVVQQCPNYQESIDYDLMVFQESLKLNKSQQSQTPFVEENQQVMNRQPLAQTFDFKSNTMKMPKKSMGRYDVKNNFHDSLTFVTPSTQRLEFSKDWKQFKNIHKTSACFKPVLSNQKNDKVVKGNQSDNILNIIRLRSKRGSAQGQILKIDDENPKKYGSIPTQEVSSGFQQRMELMRKAYEAKIAQIQAQRQSLSERVQELNTKTGLQEEQKRQIIKRMESIQKQFKLLQSQNILIKEIDNELEKIQHQSPSTQDCFTQTQTSSQNSRPSQSPDMVESLRSSLELTNENWFTKAKLFKSELQRQKIHAKNLQAELRVSLQNKDIEWRVRYDRLQKQLMTLNDKYNSKCIEVRDKENLLNRFLVSK